ncbi:hypothetical protein C7U57_15495 [Pseudomonas sp. R9.37]|nr:hypothetical protein C7U57_15495 [Pseudomonas sp. R9.37]
MWERACSRRRCASQDMCGLSHRFREQARSHRDCMGVRAIAFACASGHPDVEFRPLAQCPRP